jgi:Na+/H+ antiporter NhaD/arsenite permease-like protein
MSHERTSRFRGPRLWVIVAIIAAAIGALVGAFTPVHPYTPPPGAETPRHLEPGTFSDSDAPRRAKAHSAAAVDARDRDDASHAPDASHHTRPDIPAWLLAPFVALLASIALLPFLLPRFWNTHYPALAFGLGAFVLAYYLVAFGAYGRYEMLHSGLEYLQFIGLVGSLFVATGGIVFRVNARGAPVVNAALLLTGALLANVIGTAGASILLIRPFMQINNGRLRPLHIVFFIFIVSNCGGALTPIGDPPLYLGFLKGVPFFWTLENLWQEWLVCVGMLLAGFVAVDLLFERADLARAAREPDYAQRLASFVPQPGPVVSIRGAVGIVCLALIVLAVFIDPILKDAGVDTHGVPAAPFVQLAIAFVAFKGARPEFHAANEFNFHPVQEVAYLFAGIFFTMAPALGYLAIHGPSIGLQTPTHYYFATGALSAVLDNAPTYLNFLQTALASEGYPLSPAGINEFLGGAVVIERDGVEIVVPGALVLAAISLGAVFFGAATYIGNAPNFMVKAIAEADGVRMPGFLGYLRYSVGILLPILFVVWLVFLRL